MHKKIILVCQVFYPDPTATSQLFTELFTRLSAQNTDIEVICGFPTTRDRAYLSLARDESYAGIEIHRCGLNMPSKGNYLFRAICYLSFLIHAGFKLLLTRRDSLIFGVTNPPFLCILLFLICSIKGTKYHYMFQDIYPDGLVALGKIKNSSLVFKLWHFLNKISYSKADRFLVLGRDMTALIQNNYGIAGEKITYIPHWSATAIAEPKSKSESKLHHFLAIEHKFVVQYSGNMGLWHDINSFVLAAKTLSAYPDIQFLFVGGGTRKQLAVELAAKEGVTNIIWKNFVPKEELEDSLACCDVALISLRAGLAGVAVPCKLYGILASGKAIIAQVPSDSEVALVVNEERCGLVVEPDDIDGLVNSILDLYRDRQLTRDMGKKSFDAYQTKYTSESAIAQFERLFEVN